MVLSIFSCAYWYIFLGEMSIQVFIVMPIFELGFLMLLLSCISLYSVDINPLAVYDLQIFSPIPLVVYVLTSHNDTLRSVVRNSLKN